jgi:hypothetical protein
MLMGCPSVFWSVGRPFPSKHGQKTYPSHGLRAMESVKVSKTMGSCQVVDIDRGVGVGGPGGLHYSGHQGTPACGALDRAGAGPPS